MVGVAASLSSAVLVFAVACGGNGEGSGREAGPEFSLEEGLYVGVEEVKRALDRRADFILLDARASSDFEVSHITGAVSVPYYEVEKHLAKLPKDAWIVAYCSCPRAEAESAVDVLRENGYTRTSVLYEGYPEWESRGYPTSSGAEG
jgi:rhodanese-related sulfurtransferase